MSLFRRRKTSAGSKASLRRTSTGKQFNIRRNSEGNIIVTQTAGKPLNLSNPEQKYEKFEQLVSPEILESLDEKERKRQQVIFELIQTEGTYLQDLSVMKNLFRHELQLSGCISPEEIYKIFSNLDDIIETSSTLYEKLLGRRQNGLVGRMADIFVDMFEQGKLNSYVTFCANQLPASERYGFLMQQNQPFVEVIQRCSQKTELTKGFDLPAFLLKGMQRLLKYHPLLQQILKRTNDQATADQAELQRAMDLIESHGKIVNEAVRESENKRRLPLIKNLLVRETTSMKWVKPQFNLDITDDPDRRLVHEGRLKYVRPLGPGGDQRTVEMYVILLSDMILLTTERDGKFIIKEGKEPSPVISISAITDITTELTLPSRSRTTLCFELANRELEYDTSLVSLDGPRPVRPSEHKTFLRFIAPAQGQLQTWMKYLRKTRQQYSERAHELVRTASQTESIGSEEYAVTMLVSRVENIQNSAGDPRGVPDWEISWASSSDTDTKGESLTTLTTRSVRLIQGPDGLGFTLIGRNPVEFQEVDVGGPAHQSGVREGDQIRAVDGIECTNAAHHEVIALIRDALRHPKKAVWVPVIEPIQEITEIDSMSISSLGRNARSMRKALLTDSTELEQQA